MARRVYIIWTRPLFHEALMVLLKHPEVEIVGTSTAVDSHELDALQPDTIIIEETEETPVTDTDISRLLDNTPSAVRAIRLSLEDNILKMIQREERVIQQAEDLLHFLEDE